MPRRRNRRSHCETSSSALMSRARFLLEDTELNLEAFKYKLTAMMRNNPDAFVTINRDKNVKYDSVIQVMDVLPESGVKNPGLGIELKNE